MIRRLTWVVATTMLLATGVQSSAAPPGGYAAGVPADAAGPTARGDAAHPGHGSKVVLGVLREVSKEAIVVEVVDPAAGGTRRVRVLLMQDTRYRIDKERLTSLEGLIGQRAIVSVDWEDDDRGAQLLHATEVRFTRKK